MIIMATQRFCENDEEDVLTARHRFWNNQKIQEVDEDEGPCNAFRRFATWWHFRSRGKR